MFKGRKTDFKAMPLLFTLLIGGVFFFIAFKTDVIAMPGEESDYTEVSEDDGEKVPEITKEENNDNDETEEPIAYCDDRLNIEDVTRNGYNVSIDELIYRKENAAAIGEVDEEYFADALFIGDSRTDGLRLFSPVGKASYFCKTGLNIIKLMSSDTVVDGKTLRQLLSSKKFGKIYIELGVNEGDYNTPRWLKIYADAVNEIRELQPDAIICIQAIMYVTEEYGIEWKYCKKENLDEKNEGLKELCDNEYVFYIDVNEAVVDESGHLNPEYTGDGMHLKAKYYYLWRDYIMQHAVIK
ncbi:MAG: hypothetical protein IKX99_00515 [Lachnospiraceae bacterium]|nr:hypothetical protein [Lachnospiraceae bacterium]MBR5788571.1 hypothetical protein [Lachnospiraceae bacterium]